MVEFHSIAGNIDIITGNLKTSLITGQKVRIGLDKYTSIVYVQSIDGNTTSFIAGSRILILQNSGVQIKLDPISLKTTITVTAGTVNITSIDGTRHILNHEESINIQGMAVKPQFEDSLLPKTVAEAAAEGIKTVEQAAAEYADGTANEGTALAEETGYSAEADDDFIFFMDQPSEMPSEPEIVEASPYLP
jgi:hypothetical protein